MNRNTVRHICHVRISFLLVTRYYNVAQQIIVSCILSISSLTIITSFVAMVVSAGFPRERLEFLRHYSVFNVVSCEPMSNALLLCNNI